MLIQNEINYAGKQEYLEFSTDCPIHWDLTAHLKGGMERIHTHLHIGSNFVLLIVELSHFHTSAFVGFMVLGLHGSFHG